MDPDSAGPFVRKKGSTEANRADCAGAERVLAGTGCHFPYGPTGVKTAHNRPAARIAISASKIARIQK
jgi:hypothetical protein